ncbi:hypothetical protein TNCV_2748661 [Trichonephila clavipes]|nr:hypothetical protein TNCV_2748661 [Trichonephila clavipes]
MSPEAAEPISRCSAFIREFSLPKTSLERGGRLVYVVTRKTVLPCFQPEGSNRVSSQVIWDLIQRIPPRHHKFLHIKELHISFSPYL